jgi:outer membrane receptor protein involved in Fe transport
VRDDLSRDLYTLRAGVSLTPAPAWGVSAGLNYTRSDFRANDPLFLQTRKDDYYGVDATVSYRWSRQLSIRGEYTWSDNRSNLALYKYDRSVIAVKVRYDFQ